MTKRHVRLVLPHQLFRTHLDAEQATTFVLVEHDLMFRQYRFHQQKLVLHRASMRRFADLLRGQGFDVEVVETDVATTSREALATVLRRLRPTRVSVYDVVDDWLSKDLTHALSDSGHELRRDEVLETPNFLTTRAQLTAHFKGSQPRMQQFYAWQRRRLDVLVEPDGGPIGGRWSFDEENRKKLPRGHVVPQISWPQQHAAVAEAIEWVQRDFSDNPGYAESFAWPTSHAEAEAGYSSFLDERFAEFGPYEDAISTAQPFVFHSLISPALNIGLLSPRAVLDEALDAAAEHDIPIASLEGFLRQLIGWREYMRATYLVHGRQLRSGNRLEHSRQLADGWWTADTGLDPVDHVLRGVLEHGWAHHIERLMVLGNAMCLLRTEPDAAYEWFMEMFVDAYDWVMVPNVYAMSQFAAGDAITTKPYISGSNYLRKMSDLPAGGWCDDWDGLYWTFVRDHFDVFAGNPRSRVVATAYDRLDPAKKALHARHAAKWLAAAP